MVAITSAFAVFATLLCTSQMAVAAPRPQGNNRFARRADLVSVGDTCNVQTDHTACADRKSLLFCVSGKWSAFAECTAGTMCKNGMCVLSDNSGKTSAVQPQPTPTTTLSSLFSSTSSASMSISYTRTTTIILTTTTNIYTPGTSPSSSISSVASSASSPGGGGDGGSSSSNFGITCDTFNKAVVNAGKAISQSYPTPSSSQCSSFLNGMVSRGKFTSAREAAMFLANILWESDGLQAKEEYDCKTLPTWCAQNYATPNDVPGQTYWGRGYIQLTWHYNYIDASKGLFGDDRLAKNTAQVATNEDLAWGVSFWFWSDRVRSDAGVQAGRFGSSINKINGGLECNGGSAAAKAKKRYDMYKVILPLFAPSETPIESGCYN